MWFFIVLVIGIVIGWVLGASQVQLWFEDELNGVIESIDSGYHRTFTDVKEHLKDILN